MSQFTRDQNDTPMHENNVNKSSKCELCHKDKEEPQYVVQHKLYF